MLQRTSSELLIVTAASSNHFNSLLQFIGSAISQISDLRIIIYNLGLTKNEIEILSIISHKQSIELKTFNYSKYPDHFNLNINFGQYSWKAAIIKEVADENKSFILWCDAGNMLTNDLSSILNFLTTGRIYSPISSGSIRDWTHPKCLNFFNINTDHPINALPSRNGAILGFDNRNGETRNFIDEFYRLSCIKECIAPQGSDRTNHRQDQSIFSIIYYITKAINDWPSVDDYFGITIHNDNELMQNSEILMSAFQERTPYYRSVEEKWYLIAGDSNLRNHFNLNVNSIVFDLGGFNGDWTQDISSKYDCHCHIFEPIKDFSKNISDRFKDNNKITSHMFALGSGSNEFVIYKNENASSSFTSSSHPETVHQKDFICFLKENQIIFIDLIKINIEGAEYDFLEYLLNEDFLSKINYIQVQFHDFIKDAKFKRNKIRQGLEKTHRLVYDFPFVWESWELQ